MEYHKIAKLLGTTPDEVLRFITKKWIEVHDQSGNAEDRYKPSKQIRFKTSMLRSDLCDFSDAYIVVKGNITVNKKTFTANDFEAPNNTALIMHLVKRNWFLKIMHHLSIVFQKLMV